MRGYRCEDWTKGQLEKALKLPMRGDFYFRTIGAPPPRDDTMVAVSLPVCLKDASLMGPDHKDKLSVIVGSMKRLAAEVPICNFKKMKKILTYSRKFIFPQFRTFHTSDIKSQEDWITDINHPESRKKELREALVKLETNGLLPVPGYDTDESPDPTEAASFTKDEKYEEEKPLRWINSSSDLLKVGFGPIADKCMEMLVECRAMIKTVPVSERAKAIWDDLGGEGVEAQSSDATAMEDHYANIPPRDNKNVGDPRYRISNELMIHMCGGIQVPLRLLRAVKFTFMRTPGFAQKDPAVIRRLWTKIEDSPTLKAFFLNIIDGYRKLKMRNFGYVLVNGILCSGEMNTSFKNTASMYIMTNFASYDLSNGRYPYVVSKNEGDDSLAVYRKGFAPTEAWWLSYGWVVKVEFIGLVNEASFCGLVFAPCSFHSIPDIRKVLMKFGWSNRRYVDCSDACRMSLLRAKAFSIACEYNNVPILGVLAQRLLELTKHVNVRKSIIQTMDQYERNKFEKYLNLKPWEAVPNPTHGTRLLVQKLQNITVGEQLEIEERFKTLSLGFFEVPELIFPAVCVNNMARCGEERRTPRIFNFEGRKRVTDALKVIIERDSLWPEKKKKMISQLGPLARGRV